MKKIICFALSLLFIVACESKKAQPAESQNDVATPELSQKSVSKDDANVNHSSETKDKDTKSESKSDLKNDPVVGMFICKKTNDKYIFNDDGTGFLFSSGSNTEFKWERKNDMVILTYEAFGKEYLLYDPKKQTLKEDSEMYGVLIYNKL